MLLRGACSRLILILIHHIHVLMYVPTIAVIVVLRYYLLQGDQPANVAVGLTASYRAWSALCSWPRSSGERCRFPEAEFVGYLKPAWPIRLAPIS